jgi:hypothetical protein
MFPHEVQQRGRVVERMQRVSQHAVRSVHWQRLSDPGLSALTKTYGKGVATQRSPRWDMLCDLRRNVAAPLG